MAHNFYDKSPMWPEFNHGCPRPVPDDAEPYNTPYAVLGYTEAGEPVFTVHTVDGETYDVEVGSNIVVLGDTTYTLQASDDGTKLTLVGSDGSTSTVPMYSATATTTAAGLMSPEDKAKLDGIESGAQKNAILGIRGSAEETYTQSGYYTVSKDKIGLGNVENKSASDILGEFELTSEDVVDALGYTPAQASDTPVVTGVMGVKGNAENDYRTGDVNITKANIGLGDVENKSSATIRSEITSSNVTSALGYTPLGPNDALSASRVKYVVHEIEIVGHGSYASANIPLSNLGVNGIYSDDCIIVNAIPHYFSGIQFDDITCMSYINDSTNSLFYRVDNHSGTNTIVHVIITVFEADATYDSRT